MKISCSNTDISLAAKVISNGGIVVFPTDTVYGIGCDPYSHEACLLYTSPSPRDATLSRMPSSG